MVAFDEEAHQLQCGHGSDAVETAVVVAEEYERLKRASMRPRQ